MGTPVHNRRQPNPPPNVVGHYQSMLRGGQSGGALEGLEGAAEPDLSNSGIRERLDATRSALYEVVKLPSELANQVEVIQRCAELTAESMPRLQTMSGLEEYWIEINRLENLGDKSYRRILAKLFSGKYEALEVMKLKDIVDSLEAAIDAFETVANIVEQIAVKES